MKGLFVITNLLVNINMADKLGPSDLEIIESENQLQSSFYMYL